MLCLVLVIHPFIFYSSSSHKTRLLLFQTNAFSCTKSTKFNQRPPTVCPLIFDIPLVFISANDQWTALQRHTTLLHNRTVDLNYYKCAADMKVGSIVGGFANDFYPKTHLSHDLGAGELFSTDLVLAITIDDK